MLNTIKAVIVLFILDLTKAEEVNNWIQLIKCQENSDEKRNND